MRSIPQKFRFLSLVFLLGASLASLSVFAADKPRTFTGRVSDAMCGAHHMMAGEPADCLRGCIRKGSKYALVVGDKVYALDSSDKPTLDKLDQLADRQAKVEGQANGDTIAVSSVAPAK